MLESPTSAPTPAGPASAVIVAARQAKTPLAVADARAPGAPLLFANEAFALLVGEDAAALVGRPLAALALSADGTILRGGTSRFELATKDRPPFPVALSTAAVTGADGTPSCLLCSLADARGDGADAAIARDAALLAQVADAASDLMQESAIAARVDEHGASTASGIALDAVAHVVAEDRS